jgi:cyclohexanone monooxygenase
MSEAIVDKSSLDFDPDALRDKYREERDKRLRTDANQQYIEVKGDSSHYVDDPYLTESIKREPLTDETDVIIVGGGFGGLLMGARLRNAGIKDLRIIEKGGDFGGTWYWNRYPGAACDIESYIYLPLLEELNFMPVEKYTRAPEILAHCRTIGEHFNLYDKACFQTEVTELHWEEAISRWIVETNRGDKMQAKFVAMANGPLHRPKLPGIPGIDSYKGHSFHTSRWDYDYTGGTALGNLDKLKDKRIGIIGTGATAVQCVPHLGAGAKELYVFQRTPSSIDVRDNYQTDPEWAKSLEPGWQKERMENFNVLVSGGYQDKDLVADGWTDIIRNLATLVNFKDGPKLEPAQIAEAMELADFKKMEQIRGRVEDIVEDPATAEALKPYYRQFCKRPCFHDEYLPAFNLPGVHLIDTEGRGVERITEKGVVVDGKEYEVDCLIFATGFEVGTDYTRRSGYDVVGRDGLKLSEKWADGVRTLHGMHSHGFPNLFIISNAQAGFTANFPHALDEQAKHMAYIVKYGLDGNVQTIEVEKEAEDAWVETIVSLARLGGRFQEECTPGYYNNEGNVSALSSQNSSYGAGSMAFFKLIKDWRDAGTLEGLKIS